MPRCRLTRAVRHLSERQVVFGIVVIIDTQLDLTELVLGLGLAQEHVTAVQSWDGRAGDVLDDRAACLT
jgi:hypothetical protein